MKELYGNPYFNKIQQYLAVLTKLVLFQSNCFPLTVNSHVGNMTFHKEVLSTSNCTEYSCSAGLLFF